MRAEEANVRGLCVQGAEETQTLGVWEKMARACIRGMLEVWLTMLPHPVWIREPPNHASDTYTGHQRYLLPLQNHDMGCTEAKESMI